MRMSLFKRRITFTGHYLLINEGLLVSLKTITPEYPVLRFMYAVFNTNPSEILVSVRNFLCYKHFVFPIGYWAENRTNAPPIVLHVAIGGKCTP